MSCRMTKAGFFLEKLKDMMEFLIPNYILEGKNQLVIAIGCTGGKTPFGDIGKTLFTIYWRKRKVMVCALNTGISGKDSITKRK